MKILSLIELSPRLVDSQLTPLTRIKKIEQIYIVRNSSGPQLSKLEYSSPPRIIKKMKYIDLIFKLFLTLKLINKHNPKLITSFYLVPHGVLAFLCAKITGKPICLSLLGTDLNVHCKRKYIGKVLIWILSKSDFITVPGSISKQFLIDKGVPNSKLFVLPNTIDTSEFHPTSTPKKYDLITIGRLVEVKHLEILLKMISTLKQKYPSIKVGIAGSGPLSKKLEHQSIQLGLENNIEFLGFVEDANQFLNSGKIYVLTSESEGLPTAMVEAMACGIPPVVSNVGNISDVAINGENSIVIDDYRDVDSYIGAISKLIKDRELYDKLSRNALKVRKKYSVANATRVWKNILLKLQLS